MVFMQCSYVVRISLINFILGIMFQKYDSLSSSGSLLWEGKLEVHCFLIRFYRYFIYKIINVLKLFPHHNVFQCQILPHHQPPAPLFTKIGNEVELFLLKEKLFHRAGISLQGFCIVPFNMCPAQGHVAETVSGV